jgi:hypothetical protein
MVKISMENRVCSPIRAELHRSFFMLFYMESTRRVRYGKAKIRGKVTKIYK